MSTSKVSAGCPLPAQGAPRLCHLPPCAALLPPWSPAAGVAVPGGRHRSLCHPQTPVPKAQLLAETLPSEPRCPPSRVPQCLRWDTENQPRGSTACTVPGRESRWAVGAGGGSGGDGAVRSAARGRWDGVAPGPGARSPARARRAAWSELSASSWAMSLETS